MKTFVKQTYPWGLFARNGHRLLCSDGVVRAASMSSTPDTFFSIPAFIRIKGKTITGYATTEDLNGERVWCFRHHTKHSESMPPWPCSRSQDFNTFISKAA
jgi:hypothetical protein